MDDFDMYSVAMDAECVSQDFDDIDLYAEHTIVEDEECESDILFQ